MSCLAAIGECMMELSRNRDGSSRSYSLGYGGDTLNVALYFARWGGCVEYVTALGDDPFSAGMYSAWQAENIGVRLVQKIPSRQSGLYMVETDDAGERSFYYWRNQSPARELFELEGGADLLKSLAAHEYLYFSGITLSLFSQKSLDIFYDFLAQYRQAGGKVIFDLNYRSAGWETKQNAQDVMGRFISLTDIALPSQDDEQLLYGGRSVEQIIECYVKLGVREVVLKCGDKGCVLWYDHVLKKMPADIIHNPVDTTAAGDSFNGGYLAARLCGINPEEAVVYGQKSASLVVQHPGAIVAKSDWPAHYRMNKT